MHDWVAGASMPVEFVGGGCCGEGAVKSDVGNDKGMFENNPGGCVRKIFDLAFCSFLLCLRVFFHGGPADLVFCSTKK